MSCTDPCCGFVSLTGMVGLGSLTVSHGLGGCQYDPIPLPVDPLAGFQEGLGRETILLPQVLYGPKTILRFPELELEGICDEERSRADTAGGPRVQGDAEVAAEEEPVSPTIQAVTRRGPTVRATGAARAATAPPAPGTGASVQRGPKVVVRASGAAVEARTGPTVSATTKPGPTVTGEPPEPEEGTQSSEPTITVKKGPKTIIRKG
jgi:hypothetical protein